MLSDMSKKQSKKSEELFNLRQVIEITGLSEFTLRGWEGRYAAFTPLRTPSGRRLYSLDDLRRIRLLMELTRHGQKIGQISNLSLKELQELTLKTLPAMDPSNEKSPHEKKILQLLKEVQSFEWDEVDKIFQSTKASLSQYDYVFHFIIPLMKHISEHVLLGHLSISQEHILSSMIKEALYSLRPSALRSPSSFKKKKSKGTKLVMAAPEADFHDLGILVAATLARFRGVDYLYLGPNMPKTELCETAIRYGATHLLLAATVEKVEGSKDDFLSYLNFLDRQIPKKVTFWTGGRAAANLSLNLKRSHSFLGSLQEFDKLLEEIS
jgi:methanogenic corrinoid protein MtbC1